MWDASGKNQFASSAQKGVQGNSLSYMLGQLRNLYANELKDSYGYIRNAYYNVSDKENSRTITGYLENAREAVKSISKLFSGQINSESSTKTFTSITKVESNIKSILETAKTDEILAGLLVNLQKKGLSFSQFLVSHETFRKIVKAGDGDAGGLMEKLKSISPDGVGLAKFGLGRLALGLLGPASIPLGFLGKVAFGAAKRFSDRALSKAKNQFDLSFAPQGMSGEFADDDYSRRSSRRSSWSSRYNRSGMEGIFSSQRSASGKEYAGYARDGSRNSRWRTASENRARSSLVRGTRTGGLSYVESMVYFWHKEAYKTRYLKDLMTILGKKMGKSGGGLLGGVAAGVAAGVGAGLGEAAGLGSFMLFRKQIASFMSKAAKGLKVAGKVFFWATIAFDGITSIFQSFSKTKEIFGKSATVMQQIATGWSLFLNKITFGLVKIDKAAKFFDKAFAFAGAFSKSKILGIESGTTGKSGTGKASDDKISKTQVMGWIGDWMTLGPLGFIAKTRGTEFLKSKMKAQKPISRIVNQDRQFPVNSAEVTKSKELDYKKEVMMAIAVSQSSGAKTEKSTNTGTVSVPSRRHKALYRANDPFVDSRNAGEKG